MKDLERGKAALGVCDICGKHTGYFKRVYVYSHRACPACKAQGWFPEWAKTAKDTQALLREIREKDLRIQELTQELYRRS